MNGEELTVDVWLEETPVKEHRALPQMIVLSPPGLIDPSLSIAASRAGETGVLDLEYARDAEVAREALARLAHYGRNRIGVKFGGHATDLFSRIVSELPESLSLVILTCSDPDH